MLLSLLVIIFESVLLLLS
jgi:hypothetical protein